MPQVEFTKRDLENLLGFDVPEDQLETYFMPAKCELDSFDGNVIKLKATDTNRPDLWGVEGVVRELKAHLGLEKGLPKYKFAKSDYSIEVSGKNNFNPKEASAIIRNVNVDEDLLLSMINFQEKVCNSYGSRRKEFALGIYALNKVNGKLLRYTLADKKTKFKPLGYDSEMTLEEVLKVHPKGKEYGYLLNGMDKYPVWIDEQNKIMSMPPIVNSNDSGKVELGKQDLFLEVTGKSQEKVDLVLLIFAMALADRGAKVESVNVNYVEDKKSFVTLDQTPYEMVIDKQKIFDYLGEQLTDAQVSEFLERKHYEVKILGSKITVKYPKYRQDVLHFVDVIEDLIIEFGYNTLHPKKLEFSTTGKLLPKTEFNNLVREASIGLGLQEVVTFNLTSVKKQYDNLKIKKENINCVEIANPMSESIAIFRAAIIPELLEFLSKNQHISYPQDIFELGVTERVLGEKNNLPKEIAKEETHLCFALCHNESSYTQVKQKLDAILRAIDAKEIKYEAKDYPFLISKRSAIVSFKLNNKECKGFIGELHPDTLMAFGLNMPVACFEINIDKYD